MSDVVAQLYHRRRIARAVLRDAIPQAQQHTPARVAAMWAVAESTSMDAKMDAALRAIVLEGAFGVPFGTWANRPNPIGAAQAAIQAKFPKPEPGQRADPTVAENVEAAGWFQKPGTTGYINLYRMLSAKAVSVAKGLGMDAARGEDGVAALLVKPGKKVTDEHGHPVTDEPPVKSNAHAAGAEFGHEMLEGKVTPSRALNLLSTMVTRRVQDIAKGRKKDETRRVGPTRDDEGRESDPLERIRHEPEKPSINEVVRASFHDPDDPLGKFLHQEMRKTFENAYEARAEKRAPTEEGRARALAPPMLHFLDKMEDPNNHVVVDTPHGQVRRMVLPTLRDVADDLNVARSTVRQRHVMPLMMQFTQKLRRNPRIMRAVTKMLEKRGYSDTEIRTFFESPNPFGVASEGYGTKTIKLSPEYQSS